MFKLLILISILIAFVDADYNFQDSEFNRLIFEDLTDEPLETLRYKRGSNSQECQSMKDANEKGTYCCNSKKADQKELEAMKEVKEKCTEEVSGDIANDVSYGHLNSDSVQSVIQTLICVTECMAKKFDMITETGDLNRDVMLNYTRKMVGDNQWKGGVLEENVDTCLAKVNASKPARKSHVRKACNNKALEFSHCIWRKYVDCCPVDLRFSIRKC